MKWLKKYKTEIIGGLQFFISVYMMIMGFWFTYLWIWFKVGLPIEWYSVLTTMVLALLSVGGLFHWISET